MLSRRRLLAGVPALLVLGPRRAAAAGPSLVDYLANRDDLSRRSRKKWIRAVRLRFGGVALASDQEAHPEIGVAKAILSSAIFMGVEPRKAAAGAWAGWRSAMDAVPPPIAIHYQILVFEGRPPRGRPVDLALSFPEYFNEEIAPDLVLWWMRALKDGQLPDEVLAETREALSETRVKMRPLLLDRLRLLARLDRDRQLARGARRAELTRDLETLERELAAFVRVSRRPEVLDSARRPYDRLRLALDDFGLDPTDDDRALDPTRPPPPPKPVPAPAHPARPDAREAPLVEPEGPPPLEHLPPQPRAETGRPWRDPVARRSPSELAHAYRTRLERSVAAWLGTPYRWGNDTPGVGTDCSGFTRGLLSTSFGVHLPRVSRDQFRCGRSVSRRGLQPGDLVFFDMKDRGRVDHVGIYLGDGVFVHASSTRGVVRDKMASPWFRRAYRGARRVLAYPS